MSFPLSSWTYKLNAYLSVKELIFLVHPSLARKAIDLSAQKPTKLGKLSTSLFVKQP